MFIIYDLIFLVVAVLHLPVYLFKRKFHQGFLLRLGFLPKDLELQRPIWLHAVSVGEAQAIKGLVWSLRQLYPQKRFVFSTVTAMGNKVIRDIALPTDFVTYLPLDISFTVKRVINKIKPAVFIIAETEIWPNLISYLYQKNIPVIMVNGRISDASWRGYSLIKFLLRPLLNKISLFCAQTPGDAKRLTALGMEGDRLRITGNMKFDLADGAGRKTSEGAERNKFLLGLSEKEKLWVAASTHLPEEKIILDTYKKLLDEFPDLRLLIAPRHPQRAGKIERIIIKYGFNPFRVSQLTSEPVHQLSRQTGKLANRQTIFILDTIGELVRYYALADIVFVGGSLVKKGGHNILEPAGLAKPVIFGPYMFNFRDIADLFLNNSAAILAHHQEELREGVRYLLVNAQGAEKLAQAAKSLVLQNQGATQRNSRCIQQVIGLYGALSTK